MSMNRAAFRVLLVGGTLSAGALGGCNVLFGINGGEPAGQGGAGGTKGTGGAGGSTSTRTATCGDYDGNGTIGITDVSTLPAPNFPTAVVDASGSVYGSFYGSYSEFKLGADLAGYCSVGVTLDIAGLPKVGDYVVVDKPPGLDPAFGQGPPWKAFVSAGGLTQLPDGGCDVTQYFTSVAGMGTVTVTEVQGTVVKFTVTGVQATGVDDPTCQGAGVPCDGQGTIQVGVTGGESDCFNSGSQ
jgi:hypothetical protein